MKRNVVASPQKVPGVGSSRFRFSVTTKFNLIPTSPDPVSRTPVAVSGRREDLCDVMRTSLFVGLDYCDTFDFPYRGSSQLNFCLSILWSPP